LLANAEAVLFEGMTTTYQNRYWLDFNCEPPLLQLAASEVRCNMENISSAIREAVGIQPDAYIPPFGPLVSTCAKFGIKRGMAFRLAGEKRITTFLIAKKRFVVISSIEALADPEVGNE
jgi:hypothetical protein